ncbi:hypothetical protein Tco_0499325 [Tanacetum coccineum]
MSNRQFLKFLGIEDTRVEICLVSGIDVSSCLGGELSSTFSGFQQLLNASAAKCSSTVPLFSCFCSSRLLCLSKILLEFHVLYKSSQAFYAVGTRTGGVSHADCLAVIENGIIVVVLEHLTQLAP